MATSLAKELNNFFAIIHDLASESETWSSRPAWLEFAPNNVCNLRCIMCGQSDGLPVAVMDKDKAVEVLDQVLPSASLLTPSALSEPMLANMKLMVEKCREYGVYLNFHTNATVLDGPKLRDIGDRIHKLFISFDSPVKATFEELRAPADYDLVLKNIRSILPVAQELNIPVGFVSVFMRQNAAEIPQLVDFLADLGAAEAGSELRVQPMLDNSSRTSGMLPGDVYSESELLGFLDEACARAEARGMLFFSEMDAPFARQVTPTEPRVRGVLPDVLMQASTNVRERYPGFCSMASYYMKIEPTGEVFPCCRAPEELEMGNVHEQSIEEIWNGERYRDFRRRMFAGDYPDVCASCDVLVANPRFRELQQDRASEA